MRLIPAGVGIPLGLEASWGGVPYCEITLQNLTWALEYLSKNAGDALQGLCTSLDSLANVLLDNSLALDYLLGEQGRVCAVMNETCCMYVNNSGQIEGNIKEIHEQAQWLHRCNTQGPDPSSIWNMVKQSLPSLTWFLPFLGPLTAIILLLIFGSCLLNYLVNFVCKCLEAIKLQMILTLGYKQLGLQAGEHQIYFRPVREQFCSSNPGKNYAHVQQQAASQGRALTFSMPSRMRNSSKPTNPSLNRNKHIFLSHRVQRQRKVYKETNKNQIETTGTKVATNLTSNRPSVSLYADFTILATR